MVQPHTCPNGHRITEGIVCGGDGPWHNHGEAGEKGNVYFLMDLATGHYIHRVVTDFPYLLTEADWEDMENHADGGCCGEPQCPDCLEYLGAE